LVFPNPPANPVNGVFFLSFFFFSPAATEQSAPVFFAHQPKTPKGGLKGAPGFLDGFLWMFTNFHR